ncbi:MAG: hypothetical protein KGK30_10360, partial [Elusimicrobia bacterium]|nr:hypothetical protein [Elusimicrobiota bacterium]
KERLESNDARAEFMAESFVRREAWPHAVQELDRLRRVTKADVLRVAAKYLGPDRVIVYRRRGQAVIPHISKPGFTTVPIDSSRQSAFARRILALPAPPIQPHWLLEGRDYEQAELPSGTFFTARNPFDDLFSLTWVFEEGRRQQPDLCAALDLLELSGAGLLSADAFKKKLFSLGTSLSYSCGDQESSVTLTGLDRNFWESLQLMRRRFESPNVDAGTLHKMVDVAIGAHRDAKSDPGTVFGALGEWARRGADSPVLRELSDDQLRRLDLKTLESLLAKLPRTAHRTAYVGDRPIGEVAQLLAQEGRYAPAPPRIPERLLRPDGPRVVFTPRKMV